jgi:hypothetical protein
MILFQFDAMMLCKGGYTIADMAIYPWIKHRLDKWDAENLFKDEFPNVIELVVDILREIV